MSIIKKKCHPKYFKKILTGEKNFELRLNDFSCKKGDILLLEEWDPETKNYTGRSVSKKVSYVAKFKIDKLFWSKIEIEKKGIQIIALK
jgi:ribosomal protein S17